MKAVVQRVKGAELKVGGELISEIESGLVVYFGVAAGDTEEQAERLAKKISALRIFSDENGKMNLSVKDVGGQILSVSQFTLLADTARGNRPSFASAEVPQRANELYEYFCRQLENGGICVKKGVFGADMQIYQHCDGPVTIVYEV